MLVKGVHMKKAVILFAVLMVLASCNLWNSIFGTTANHTIQLYLSLGSASTLPGTGDYQNLLNYGYHKAIFSVQGVDTGVNTDINLADNVSFQLTGSNPTDYTEYAVKDFDLVNAQGKYPAGRFRFRMYVDWNDNGTMDTGDVVMTSYSLLADKDNNPNTPPVDVSSTEYGTNIVYEPDTYSILINDPLDSGSGFQWVIDKIHEGNLTIMP